MQSSINFFLKRRPTTYDVIRRSVFCIDFFSTLQFFRLSKQELFFGRMLEKGVRKKWKRYGRNRNRSGSVPIFIFEIGFAKRTYIRWRDAYHRRVYQRRALLPVILSTSIHLHGTMVGTFLWLHFVFTLDVVSCTRIVFDH